MPVGCTPVHVDLHYLIEASRMEGAVVDSVSLDGILSNEQGNYIDLIFRLCLSVSLKDIVGVFLSDVTFYVKLLLT